jgi:ribonuclease D
MTAMTKPSALDIPHSPAAPEVSEGGSFASPLIATGAQLTELLEKIKLAERVAVDTEADSLHSYREKLCLLQISVPTSDHIVDPLTDVDFAPLRLALERSEIVLHGADYDLRMLRRGLNFVARRIFDTVIAARLLSIREFSLAALVKRYFGLELPKGSQKANWAHRPLPVRMAEYAINDVHYLLPLAEELEAELDRQCRIDWLRQSCQRAIEQAAVQRVRDEDELWRIRGSRSLRGRAAAVLRALWQWREKEAEVADRPPFHILQNHELLDAAVAFTSGNVPDYRHFSSRRRQAFREAAQCAMQLPESEWPVSRRRVGRRPDPEIVRATEELRRRRDHAARELNLEPAFIAPRSTLEAIATDQTRAAALLVPWQRELLGIRT